MQQDFKHQKSKGLGGRQEDIVRAASTLDKPMRLSQHQKFMEPGTNHYKLA